MAVPNLPTTWRFFTFTLLLVTLPNAGAAGEPAAKPSEVIPVFQMMVQRDGVFPKLLDLSDGIWKAGAPIQIGIFADPLDPVKAVIDALAAELSRASGVSIQVVGRYRWRDLFGDHDSLPEGTNVFVMVGPQEEVAKAASAQMIGPGLVRLFIDDDVPFIVDFLRDEQRLISSLMLRNDLPPQVLARFLMMEILWMLGLTATAESVDLIFDMESSPPVLTPVGERVIQLIYDPRLVQGMPVMDAIAEARRMLAE